MKRETNRGEQAEYNGLTGGADIGELSDEQMMSELRTIWIGHKQRVEEILASTSSLPVMVEEHSEERFVMRFRHYAAVLLLVILAVAANFAYASPEKYRRMMKNTDENTETICNEIDETWASM